MIVSIQVLLTKAGPLVRQCRAQQSETDR